MNSAQSVGAPKALISGASFAGLTAAFWMSRLGYGVTIVESGPGLKKGGTPVDIRDDTIAIVERMGILDAIKAKSLPPRTIEFVNIEGGIDARMEPRFPNDDGTEGDYEIHRDDLLAILFAALQDDVKVEFNNSITALTDIPDGVRVTFRDGSEGDFALVLGCDGNHSNVRRLRFGPETPYSHFLHNYFSVAIVDETFISADTTRILNTPGKSLTLNSYASTTDVVLTFHADEEISYDYHDAEQQKRVLREAFLDSDDQFAEFVEKAGSADSFYLDKLSQIIMPHWTAGRVALVGDAGYCASPAAGMGGSLAILGATALFDAMQATSGDVLAGFAEYERAFRPIAEAIQATAVNFGLPTFFPETDEAIAVRNSYFAGM